MLAGGLQVGVLLVLEGEDPLGVQGVGRGDRGDAQPGKRLGEFADGRGLLAGRGQAQEDDLRGPGLFGAEGLGLVEAGRALGIQGLAGVLGLALEHADQLVEVVDLTNTATADDGGQAGGDAHEGDLDVLAPVRGRQLDGHGIEDLGGQLGVTVDAQGAQTLEVEQHLGVGVVLAEGDQPGPRGAGQVLLEVEGAGLKGPDGAILALGDERGRQLGRVHEVQGDLRGGDAGQEQLRQGRPGGLRPAGEPALGHVELVGLLGLSDDLELGLDLSVLGRGHGNLLAGLATPALELAPSADHTEQTSGGEGADAAESAPRQGILSLVLHGGLGRLRGRGRGSRGRLGELGAGHRRRSRVPLRGRHSSVLLRLGLGRGLGRLRARGLRGLLLGLGVRCGRVLGQSLGEAALGAVEGGVGGGELVDAVGEATSGGVGGAGLVLGHLVVALREGPGLGRRREGGGGFCDGGAAPGAGGGEVHGPASLDLVGVGHALTVGLGLALHGRGELGPAAGVAELGPCDRGERVPLLDRVLLPVVVLGGGQGVRGEGRADRGLLERLGRGQGHGRAADADGHDCGDQRAGEGLLRAQRADLRGLAPGERCAQLHSQGDHEAGPEAPSDQRQDRAEQEGAAEVDAGEGLLQLGHGREGVAGEHDQGDRDPDDQEGEHQKCSQAFEGAHCLVSAWVG